MLDAVLKLLLAAALALPFLLPALRSRSRRGALAWGLGVALALAAGLAVEPRALGGLRVDGALLRAAWCVI
jgi:hypothetical protein